MLIVFIGSLSIGTTNAQCSASFTYQITSFPAIWTFTSTSTGGNSYFWDFGDGNTSALQNPSHSYLNNGNYWVCLTIIDSNTSCIDSICQSVIVTQAVQCSLTGSASSVDNGNGNYTFSSSITNGTAPYTYLWDFGDGNTSNLSSPSHTYTINGNYNACLVVVDNNFCTDTLCTSVVVTAAQPCNIAANFTSVDNGNGSISFTNTSTGSGLYSSWNFGDGNWGYTANPSNTYSTNGSYVVCLSVYDSLSGCSDTYCDSIQITGTTPPCSVNALFSLVDNGGGNYSFTNNSTGTGLNYYWYFGDGGTSNSTNPNHTYLVNGVYTVQLVASDPLDSNCYDYYLATINVTGASSAVACQAGFIVYADSANAGNVIVINSSTGNNLTYFWNFGDGNTSTLAYPSYTYSTPGPFLLCLTINDGAGCISTYCDSINAGGIVLKQSGFTINVQAPNATGIEESAEVISEFNAYPNPVKNNLTIELNMNEQTQVNVFVTDVLGNKVAQINNQELSMGVNTLKWNASNLSNGVYLLNIETGHSAQVKKLILNK